MCHGDAEQLSRSLGQAEEHDRRADERAGDQDDRLERVGEDDGHDAAGKRIDRHRDAGEEDDAADVPPEQGADRQRHEVHHGAHARELRQQIAEAGVGAGPRAKPRFEVVIGGHVPGSPVEGQEPADGNPGGQREAEAEDERVPVGRVCPGGQGEERDAADIGAENRQPRQPPGQVAVGRGEAFDRPASPRERDSHRHGEDEVSGKHEHIDRRYVCTHDDAGHCTLRSCGGRTGRPRGPPPRGPADGPRGAGVLPARVQWRPS